MTVIANFKLAIDGHVGVQVVGTATVLIWRGAQEC